jgi:hypothetical protein
LGILGYCRAPQRDWKARYRLPNFINPLRHLKKGERDILMDSSLFSTEQAFADLCCGFLAGPGERSRSQSASTIFRRIAANRMFGPSPALAWLFAGDNLNLPGKIGGGRGG